MKVTRIIKLALSSKPVHDMAIKWFVFRSNYAKICQNINGNKEEGFALTQLWLNPSISQHFPGASDKYPDKPVKRVSVQLKLELHTNKLQVTIILCTSHVVQHNHTIFRYVAKLLVVQCTVLFI